MDRDELVMSARVLVLSSEGWRDEEGVASEALEAAWHGQEAGSGSPVLLVCGGSAGVRQQYRECWRRLGGEVVAVDAQQVRGRGSVKGLQVLAFLDPHDAGAHADVLTLRRGGAQVRCWRSDMLGVGALAEVPEVLAEPVSTQAWMARMHLLLRAAGPAPWSARGHVLLDGEGEVLGEGLYPPAANEFVVAARSDVPRGLASLQAVLDLAEELDRSPQTRQVAARIRGAVG